MMKFSGIMLGMSLNPIDYGDYAAYFFRSDVDIELDEDLSIKKNGTKGWASDVMDLRRFKIMGKVFYPEDYVGADALSLHLL